MNLPIVFIGEEPADTTPIANVNQETVELGQTQARNFAGDVLLRTFIDSLSDEDREQAIAQLSESMELAWKRWEADGCFAARGEADRLRALRDDLVRGRSEAQVARMEAERGIA